MTIAAGILCADGIVLCADTEITTSTIKTTRGKLFHGYHTDQSRMACAVAGDFDFAKSALEYMGPVFQQEQPPGLENMRDAVADSIGDMYENHVWKNPVNQRDFSLLVGGWTKTEGLRLWKTVETVIHEVSGYDALGSGGDIAEYILKKRYEDDISLASGVALAIYMLAEVKRHGQHCGGETHIQVLHADGRYLEVLQEQVEEYERGMFALDYYSNEAFKACYNLDSSQADYSKIVDAISSGLKKLRGPMVIQEVRRRAAKRVPRSPKRDRKALPPSPE